MAREVLAAKRAWQFVANGLARSPGPAAQGAVALAAQASSEIVVPFVLQEAQAVSLTGPAALLGGLFRSYHLLSTRGWRMIDAAIEQIRSGPAASARFARDNVALYIESVYDGHFTLAQIGRKLLDGYRKLGAQHSFGTRLTRARVDALARSYSEAADRLHPHVGVRLGS